MWKLNGLLCKIKFENLVNFFKVNSRLAVGSIIFILVDNRVTSNDKKKKDK